jgi:glycosyltransferase involved in cell wall biosynthesis
LERVITLRVALVHDWLTGMRGGEKVLEVLCELFPDAELFTLLHNKGAMSPVIENRRIHTSFVQNMPMKRARYRNYLPLFPRAIESFDFTPYNLIVSTSHCVAKGAIPPPGALHICYCHTPMRYVWDQYAEYFGRGRADLATRIAMSIVAPQLRSWDVKTSSRVHHFIANSQNVAKRIEQYYHRSAEVIQAPVDASAFKVSERSLEFFLIVSALVPYKRLDLAIDTFNRLSQRLLVIGSGPEEDRLKSRAASNIEFLGWQSDEMLAKFYANCRALIFPGVEDFGIVPLEAMASGKPVIAFGKGGALETVVGEGKGRTGIFFYEQSVDALTKALKEFETTTFDPHTIRSHAESFGRPAFKRKLQQFIEAKVSKHFN